MSRADKRADSEAPASLTPVPKVVWGGAAGALTVVLTFVAGKFGLDVPPEVASAITVLLSVVVGYLTPNGPLG